MSQAGTVPSFEETAFWEIANWYHENGLFDQAFNAIGNALRFYPQSADLFALRSQILIRAGRMTEALESLDSAQKLADEEKRPHFYRAEAYCRRGDAAQAIRHLTDSQPVITSQHHIASTLRQANLFAQAEEYGKMFDALAEAAIRQPDNEDILEQIWMCVEINGNYKDSLALHETILDIHPYSYYAWHNLGHAHRNLGNPEGAMEAFEFAFISNPQFEAGYREFAALAFEAGLFRTALYCYQEMLERLGEEADTLIRIGECYNRIGDPKIARAMYEKALKINPFNAEAYFRIGECLAGQKEYRNALKWLREAIRNEDRREDFHAALAEVYYSLEKTDEAIEHAWKAVEIAPDEQRHWAQVAKLFMATGQPEEALEVLDSALENVVQRNELLYCRSACLFLIGDRRRAFRQLRQALTADFSGHQSLFHLAPALVNDSDVHKLIQRFR
ncbi:MAG: tetratricopeptide repeat protein [Saprospiraceae bacterium]